MDDEDIQHWYRLIAEYKRHLRILEEKVAGYGRLECPPHILKGVEDTQREIKELEQRIRRRKRNAGETEVLYSAEEVDEVYETITHVAQLEYKIPILESIVQALRKGLYWKYQNKTLKALLIFIRHYRKVIGLNGS